PLRQQSVRGLSARRPVSPIRKACSRRSGGPQLLNGCRLAGPSRAADKEETTHERYQNRLPRIRCCRDGGYERAGGGATAAAATAAAASSAAAATTATAETQHPLHHG